MEDVFISLLNISITASYLVFAVLLLRLVFKKAPKWLFCLLWALVGLRLVFPISLESALSLIPSAETVPSTIIYQQSPHINSGIPIVNEVVNPVISKSFAPDPAASANPLQIILILASWIWASGLALMLVYTLISYLKLRHRVSTATLFQDNIYQSEVVQSPFVLGLIKPKIYLPYNIADKDIGHVIAHEKAHLKRKDHLIKPLAFLILSVYWFNPLMWAAYVLLCRDIELACDEKVIRELDRDERRSYSTALLNCSVNRRMIAACPLAFGEVGVKERVKSVMNYKKPAFWIIILAVVVCIVTTVCFMTNPKSDTDISGKVFIGSEIKYNYVKNHGISGIQYCITDDMVLYRFTGDSPGIVCLGKLEKSDVTADELTKQIEGQEKGTNNPTYTFKSLKAAYVTEKKSDPEERVCYYVVVDDSGAVLIVTMHDYLTTNNLDYISNVEQIDVVDGADYRNTFSSLLVRITKADYMGTSQVLESVQTYYWAFDEKGGSMELTDGLVCSTKGFDMSEGKIEISLNNTLEWEIDYDKKADVESFDFSLGETATLRDTEKSGGSTCYTFDFITEEDIEYTDNLMQKAVHTDYNGVNIYLSDNSSLDGNIGYAIDNRTDKAIEYGEDYIIYRIVDGKAVRCDEVMDIAWHMILYQMSNNSTEYTSFSTGVYDISQPGLYRFEKNFSVAGEKERYKMSFDFEIMSTEESEAASSFNEAIEDAIVSKHTSKNDESITFAHHVLIANATSTPLKGESKQIETAYVWFVYEKYRVYDNKLEMTGGGANYAVLTFANTGGTYELTDYREPRDGSYHAKDIKEMFPDNVVLEPEKYNAQAENICYKKAVSYFSSNVKESIVCDVSFAYAGTSALAVKQFTELSENGDYIDQMSSIHYPVIKIETLEELENFATGYPLFKLGQSYNMAMGYPESSLNDIPSFYEEKKKYNGEFFENNNLYIIYLSSDNSLVRHKLSDVSVEKGKLTFRVTSIIPDTTVEEELGYFMLATVNKSALKDVAETDAYLAEEKTGKTYSFRKGGNDSYFTLRADGTFDIVYSRSKSDKGSGEYQLNEKTLILIDNDGEKLTFVRDRDDIYIFDKANSTSFHGEYNIPDGAAFEYVSPEENLP